jgi:hypothetical protein
LWERLRRAFVFESSLFKIPNLPPFPLAFRVVFVLRIGRLWRGMKAGFVAVRVWCESVASALSGAARPHCDCLPRLDPQAIAAVWGFGVFSCAHL